MTARGRLFVFGGVFAVVILLIAVVAIIGTSRPNYVEYSSVPFTAGERYLTDKFKPAFSFETVGEGWALDGPEASYRLGLQNRGLYIDVFNLNDAMVIDRSGADQEPVPEDMVGWYQEHPHLDTEAPEPMSVGGVKGVYFDAVLTTLPEGYDASACRDPLKPTKKALPLLSSPEGQATCVLPEDKVRIILLEDVKGEPLSIMMWSRAVDFEEHLTKTQNLLKTVEWEGE